MTLFSSCYLLPENDTKRKEISQIQDDYSFLSKKKFLYTSNSKELRIFAGKIKHRIF